MSQEYSKYNEFESVEHLLINEVPKRWNLKKLKFIGSVKMGQSPKSEDYNTQEIGNPFLQGNAEFGAVNPSTKTYCESANKISSQGDILFSVRAPVGALNIADREYGIGRGLCAITSSKVKPSFLWYALHVYRDELKSLATGSTYEAVSVDEVSNLKISVPSEIEQTLIARFLDQKTSQIDQLIEQKENLLNLLSEKRTAIITQAVTKGLDPAVEMKDSGIDWLGDVPKHWRIKRFKFCLKEPLKYGANEAAESSDPDQPRFVRITDVDDNGNLREETFRSIDAETAEPYMLEEGDLLMARSGATVGKSFIYKSNWGVACFAGYLIRARFEQEIMLADFGYLFFNSGSYWDWVNSIFIQATIQNISAEKYANLVVAVPPISEQEEIVKFSIDQRERIGKLIDSITASITQLKEYREALITASVTGQIDVRKEVTDE